MANRTHQARRLIILTAAFWCVTTFIHTRAPSAKPATPAPAAATASETTTATTQVLAIKAVKGTPKTGKPAIDRALTPLADKLEKMFPGYGSFKLAKSYNLSLRTGAGDQISLPNGDTLKITYQGMEKTMLTLFLEIPGKLKTSVSVVNKGTFFQAGLEYGEGILILAISPQSG